MMGTSPGEHHLFDVVVIGGGQAGLAVAYHLRRTAQSYVVLDAEDGPGGAWRHGWDSLRLFSPAQWSSLPGWLMPGASDPHPSRDKMLAYLAAYEARYQLPVLRPVQVLDVHATQEYLVVNTDRGPFLARTVVSATGSWRQPVIPRYPGQDQFQGRQLHSATYRSPDEFRGQRVLIVGGGNSGAQIQAELTEVADATWVTLTPPRFLPDDVDGRVLFEQATARYRALQAGKSYEPAGNLGQIVMVPPVRAARERGALTTVRPFVRFTAHGVIWPDGQATDVDAVIWCTGFQPALKHLAPLSIVDTEGRVAVHGTRAVAEPRLWLVGYGEWTGFASATIIGVGRSARTTVHEIGQYLAGEQWNTASPQPP